MGRLHKAADAEISAVAEQIADGTYAEEKSIVHVPEGLAIPQIIPGKKQSWCAFISAGMDSLGGIISNMERDIREKLPLVETTEERDILREKVRSYIDRLTEIIEKI